MATEEIKKFRRRWRWLRVGLTQIQPYPDGGLDIKDLAMLNGHLVLEGVCPPSDFQQELLDDLTEVFFNLEDEFAVEGLYESVGGGTEMINGLFTDAYIESVPGTNIGVQSQKPTFRCKLLDIEETLGTVQRGDEITINSVTYDIIGDEPDGVGTILLILHEQVT